MSDYSERKHAEMVAQVAGSAFSNVTDSIIDRHTAVKVLAITVTAELVGFAMFILAKENLTEALTGSEEGLWIYAVAAVFANGFLIVYPIYFLIAKRWPHIGAKIFLWLVSLVAGALNVAVFYALLTFEIR